MTLTTSSLEALGPRARIEKAARRRFERFGFRRTGVSEIAQDAGVAAGTLYRYFRSKEDIFLQVLAAENEKWLASARRTLEVPGSALERITRLGAAIVEFNAESALFRAVIDRDTDIVATPLLDPIEARVREQTVAMMAEVLREGVDDGSLRPIDPEKTALVLYVAGQALFNQALGGYPDLASILIDIVTNGIQRTQTDPNASPRE